MKVDYFDFVILILLFLEEKKSTKRRRRISFKGDPFPFLDPKLTARD